MYKYTVVEQKLYKKALKKLSKTYRNIDLDVKDFLTSIKTKEDLGIELKSNVFKVRVANSDKNKGKSAGIATSKNEQCLHPYYDHQNFIADQWLFAEVEQTNPASLRFFVDPPSCWNEVSKKRVKNHFKCFNLAARYSVEAGNQLACLKDTLVKYHELLGTEGIRQHLAIEAQSQSKQHSNSWQTAMYQALAANDWYCEGGFS